MFISKFYNYLFGGDELVSIDKRLDTEDKKRQQTERRYQEIIKDFAFLTESLREPFYYFLTQLNTDSAGKLCKILYTQKEINNFSGKIGVLKNKVDSKYIHPNENDIRQKFKSLNHNFRYFEGDSLTQAEDDFVIFFRAAKLTADFIECNNTDDNSVACEHAYKMLVLFGAVHAENQSLFKNVEVYFKQHKDMGSSKPIHDGLVLPIPVNSPHLKDLTGWHRFNQQNGKKSLTYFQEAPRIEEKLGHAPENIGQAEITSAQLTYSRAYEYLDLARLCKQFRLSGEIFNRCLEIEKRRKKKDDLPDTSISSNELDGFASEALSKKGPNYHLVKLTIDDPRAYLLGHIVNCCQSMGGPGEKCVIDGVTREKNGFYVLLKGKGGAMPIDKIGKINYKDFEIVGQAYAWLSMEGNLTLDSYEGLRPEDDDIATTLLLAFAKKVTEQNKSILQVTIGTGGKTPNRLKHAEVEPEKMAEGYQYVDSDMQSLLYFNKENLDNQIDALIKKYADTQTDEWRHPVFKMRENLTELFTELSLTSLQQAIRLDSLFDSKEKADFWNYADNLPLFIKVCQKNKSLIHVLKSLQNAGILNQEKFNFIIQNIHYVEPFGRCLPLMFNADLLTRANYAELIKKVEYYYESNKNESRSFTNNDKNFTRILNDFIHALSSLSHEKILNIEYYNLILRRILSAKNLAEGIISLSHANLLTTT